MFKSCLATVALFACLMACCHAAPGVVAAPLAAAPLVSYPGASAHIVPGSPFVTGYSHQAVRHVAVSGRLLAAPIAPYAAAPIVAHPFAARYLAAPAFL